MSDFYSNKDQWGEKKLIRLMKRAERKMTPHIDTFCSDDGLMAGLLIAGAALVVAEGKESKRYFKSITKLASEISGIPLSAMTAHAECSLARQICAKQSQRSSPSVGGDEDA